MPNYEALRSLGSFPSLQIAATADDSDLVSAPVSFVPGAHTLQNHGGPTVAHPKLVLLWCGTPSLDRARFEQFAKELMENGYLAALSYAGCTGGQFLGGFGGPSFTKPVMADSEIRSALLAWVQADPSLPQPDGSTIYAAMLPAGVTAQFDGGSQRSCAQFCAFHESPDGRFLYTVQPATNCGACNQGDVFNAACMTLSHEVAESVTDPTGQGWYEDSTGMENSDIVAWIPRPYGPWTVQGYADPQGNNVMGNDVAPAQPDPRAPLIAWVKADIDWIEATFPANPNAASAELLRMGGVIQEWSAALQGTGAAAVITLPALPKAA